MDADETGATHFLRNIIDSIGDPIVVKDEHHRFIEINRAACELMGCTREEALGRTDHDFFPKHEVDVFHEKDAEVFGTLEENLNEESITDAQGETRTISTRKSVLMGPDGRKLLVAVARDITSLREAEQRNLEMNQRLASSAKFAALGEMAGGIAHEINTPLAIIQGLADELVDMAEDDAFELSEVLRINGEINRTIARISRIISGLRSFARDGRKDAPRVVSLDMLAFDTLALCGENLQARGITLEISGGARGAHVQCRPTQIVQILLNLLNNARDAVQDTDDPRIELNASVSPDGCAQLRVIDSGPGISPPLRERIMDPFFTTKPVGAGTGIGLSIAKGLAEDNGGSLVLDVHHPSTCFVLSLPQVEEGAVTHQGGTRI